MSDYVTTAEVLKAEIVWVMKSINSHYSMNSSSDVGELFRRMFPDSKVAAQFSCGDRKAGYLTTFGLGPYFADQILKTVQSKSAYVLMSTMKAVKVMSTMRER